jgi:hypothetical protein
MLVLLIGSITSAQRDAEPPYLYYYSRMLGGIIIERADGSDSRHLGADVIPAGLTGLGGPGWSPSGRYFAVYRVIYSDSGGGTGDAYLMDASGARRVPWLQTVRVTHRMMWSPDGEDLLLVIGNTTGDFYYSPQYFFWLVDPSTDSVLTEFGMQLWNYMAYTTSDLAWETDERRIVFYVSPDITPRPYFRVTMLYDGTVLKEPVSEAEYGAHYTEPSYQTDNHLYEARGVSPSGRYEAEGKFPTILRDLEIGTEVELPTHSQGTVCRAYRWSEDEQYIITLDGTLVAGGGCAPAVLGVTDSQGRLWRELGGCSWDTPPCVDWLPPQVDIGMLPPGQPEPIQLDAAGFEPVEEPMYFFDSYNPATRLRCGEDGARFIVDTATNVVLFELNEPQPCPYNPDSLYAEEGGAPVVAAYDQVHQLIAIYPWRGGVQVWALCEDRVGIPINRLNTYGYDMEFTADGEQFRARNVNAWRIYDVAEILATADNHC